MKFNKIQGYCASLRQYRILIGSVAIGLAMLLSPVNGWAASCNNNGYIRVQANIPTTINISPTLPIGSVIGTTTTSFPTGYVEGCRITGTPGQISVYGVSIPDGKNYPTSIPGISYQLKFTSGWSVTGVINVPWPAIGTYTNATGWMYDYYGGGTITVDLIKTGPVSSSGGIWSPDILGNIDVITQGVTWNLLQIYNTQAVVVQPTAPACTITQSAITVNLDETSTAQLKAMDNTSKDTPFSIPLNCNSAANISLSFSGDIANTDKAVFRNLSNSANSNNVGVQILKDNISVPTVAGTYLNLGTINGSASIPMTARYYALTDNAGAGAVSAIAYATIVYN